MSELLRIEAATLKDAWCAWNGHQHLLNPSEPFDCASANEFINDLGPLIAGMIDARVEAVVEMLDAPWRGVSPIRDAR